MYTENYPDFPTLEESKSLSVQHDQIKLMLWKPFSFLLLKCSGLCLQTEFFDKYSLVPIKLVSMASILFVLCLCATK